MIITIQGRPREGKTDLGYQICENKNIVYVDEWKLSSPFWTCHINQDTEFIFIDDVINYESTRRHFMAEHLLINKRGEKPFSIPMPTVIIIREQPIN